MIKRLFKYSFLFLIWGCRYKPSCTHEVILKSDSSSHELLQVFNTCGHKYLKAIQEITRISKDSVIHNGYFKEFYKNGNLRIIGFKKNNIQDSITTSYYEDGSLYCVNYFANGKLNGFQCLYYETGVYKRRWYAINDSDALFKVHYNRNGSISMMEGMIQRQIWSKGPDDYVLGDTFRVINEVVVLDSNTQTNLKVKFRLIEKKLLDTSINEFIGGENKFLHLTEFGPLKEKGTYDYITIASLIDKKTKAILRLDTIKYSVTVKW